MPKRPTLDKVKDLSRSDTAEAPEKAQEAEQAPPETDSPSRPPGRPRNPNSANQRIKRGTAKQLKVVLDIDLYKRLHHLKVDTDQDLAEMAEKAIKEWMAKHHPDY